MECPALIYSFMFVQSFISNGKLILIQNETCGKGEIRFSHKTANIFIFLLPSASGIFLAFTAQNGLAGEFVKAGWE